MSTKEILGKIHLPNGENVPVIGENDRFYLCKNSQFLKSKWELHKVEKKQEKNSQKDKKKETKK